MEIIKTILQEQKEKIFLILVLLIIPLVFAADIADVNNVIPDNISSCEGVSAATIYSINGILFPHCTDLGVCYECVDGDPAMPLDDILCGVIDCDGLNYYYTDGSPTLLGTNYCMQRDYADLTADRCENLSDCKAANGAYCISYSDVVSDTCGVCQYAEGACSSCYDYSVGTDSGLCSECTGSNGNEQMSSDDTDCGTIDCDGVNFYFATGFGDPAGTNWCTYRDYVDITTNRCEGINDCKDANTGDCIEYSDSNVTTCGLCSYASSDFCPSCYNYDIGTSCGTNKQCDSGANCDDSDGQACTLDSACYSGYCDNDGQGLGDDSWCYTPYNTYFDGQENTKCEYDTGNGDIAADERAINEVMSGGSYGCPSGSTCSVESACQVYDMDQGSGVCDYTWTTTTTGNSEIDSNDCSLGVTCGDGIPSNGFCCGDDSSESWNTVTNDSSMDGPVTSSSACCAASGYCVYGGECYFSGTADVDGDGDQDFCDTPTWVDCGTSDQCGSGEECIDFDCVDACSTWYPEDATHSYGSATYSPTGGYLGEPACAFTNPQKEISSTNYSLLTYGLASDQWCKEMLGADYWTNLDTNAYTGDVATYASSTWSTTYVTGGKISTIYCNLQN